MLLQNYYGYLYGMISKNGGNACNTPITITTLQGNTTNVANVGTSIAVLGSSGASQYLFPRVGSGNTPVSLTDYDMDVDESSNFGFTLTTNVTYSNTVSNYDGDMCAQHTGIITGTNQSANSIILREFGLGIYLNQTTGSVNQGILFVREVLDNPITVPAGETFQIPYTIRLF